MGKIIKFPKEPTSKYGFKRADKRKDPTQPDQLNIFVKRESKIVDLPLALRSPFETALMLDERNDPQAAQWYSEAIDVGDSVPDAYCNLGINQSEAGNLVEAINCFTKSLELDPRHLESHYNLGNLYFGAEDLELARLHYEIAIHLSPSFSNTYFNLGLVKAMMGNFNAAVEMLHRYKECASKEEGKKADELLRNLEKSLESKSG